MRTTRSETSAWTVHQSRWQKLFDHLTTSSELAQIQTQESNATTAVHQPLEQISGSRTAKGPPLL